LSAAVTSDWGSIAILEFERRHYETTVRAASWHSLETGKRLNPRTGTIAFIAVPIEDSLRVAPAASS